MPRIMGFPEIDGRFDGPVLFLAGETSDYVLPEHWPGIVARFPAARLEKLPEVGHWLHAEAPQAFAAAVEAFLETAPLD